MFRRKARLLGVITLVGVMLVVLFVGVALAAAFNVDPFDEGQQDLAANILSPQIISDTVDHASILGGERDVVVKWINGTGEVRLAVDLYGSDLLAYTMGANVTGEATITWDGNDSDDYLDPTGLGNEDLTGGGTNDSFHLSVPADDTPIDVTLRVYKDGSNWSYYTINLPGGISGGAYVDFVVPFSSFTVGGGTGALPFNDVGAIQMFIDGTVTPGTDLEVELVEVTSLRDYGDLPSSYSTEQNGSHVPLGLRFGPRVDAEAASQPVPPALGDDNNFDDEDGVSPTPGVLWVSGAGGGSVTVVVNGCSGGCRFSGWVDWTGNSDFVDSGENILNDVLVNNGTSIHTFSIPVDPSNGNFYSRFRICETTGVCNTVDAANVTNGEVEDYLWNFGPNAITLSDLTARSASRVAMPLVGASLVLLIGLLLYARQARRRSL